MLFLPSGVNDAKTAAMAVGVSYHVLVDPTDLPNVAGLFPYSHIALDSGGYAYFKAGKPITDDMVRAYIDVSNQQHLLFRLALDQIDDHARTHSIYIRHFDRYWTHVPIYPWGAPRSHLMDYLTSAPTIKLPAGNVALVAIGGLARVLRGGHRCKDTTEKQRLDDLRDQTLDAVQALCEEFPNRFHILGLNSLPGIQRLAPLAASCDSSKWLDGGRYGYMIFKHRKTGKLSQAPAKAIPEYASLDRTQRCCRNLVNLIAASNGTLQVGD